MNASSLTTVFINLGADNSAIILGNQTSAASNNFAVFELSPFAGNTNDSLSINDGARSLSGGTYSVNTSGALDHRPCQRSRGRRVPTNPFGGGTDLEGNGASNTLNYEPDGATPTVTGSTGRGQGHHDPISASLDALNFDAINISDVPATTITPGPALTINNIGGLSTRTRPSARSQCRWDDHPAARRACPPATSRQRSIGEMARRLCRNGRTGHNQSERLRHHWLAHLRTFPGRSRSLYSGLLRREQSPARSMGRQSQSSCRRPGPRPATSPRLSITH